LPLAPVVSGRWPVADPDAKGRGDPPPRMRGAQQQRKGKPIGDGTRLELGRAM